ncbi:unnamed protein product [Eruca vesicaria subsp. sativa]|uniref:TF-B3 domain-containing protein n=1 Tax=Eruca vesicaria subsp. sativa TaxID=29727 RepID=A0ABC8M580_ERUVS|nr:unnamed protein product [Eruca vesicaria subsp. sativa]
MSFRINYMFYRNSSREKKKREKKNPRKKVESSFRPKPVLESSLHSSCYVGSVSASSLKDDKLYLGREFVTANGLNKGCSEIVLKNERGGTWTLPLKHYKSINHTYLGPGWTTFCQVNGIKAEDSFMFKLVRTGDKPVLCLCPEDSDDLSSSTSSGDKSSKSQESKEESLGDKRASSSYSQDRFVTLTLTAKAVKHYQLFLPMGFMKRNGINKPGKITLLGQDGVRRVVALSQNKRHGKMQIGKGWRVFRDAHGVKIGQPFVLELIWEDQASPVLKFCTNLNPREGSCDQWTNALGPSFCEIQYTSSHNTNDDDSHDQTNDINESSSSSDHSRFVGRSWSLKLKHDKEDMHTFIRKGWRRFCAENGMNHGHYTLKLYLGREFVSANGLDRGCSEIVLKNEWGRKMEFSLETI